MPKIAKELTPLEFRRLRHSGGKHNTTHAVGGVAGLLIQITPSNARTWLLRCQVGDKRREMGLGAYPEFSLAAARDKARETKQMIREGIDPIERRKANRAALIAVQKRGLLFADAMERFLSVKLLEFDNLKHRKQWRATLDRYALPALGNMLVADIRISDIQRVLEPIWLEKNETASRLRSRLEAVLTWATVAGHREGDNPARWKGNLDAVLQSPGKIRNRVHLPALAINEAAQWFSEVRARQGFATRALEFLAMTLARSGEIRGATWQEIDTKARLWTIPAERMKARAEHRIPLTDNSMALLNNMDRMAGNELIFPAPRGGMLSDAALCIDVDTNQRYWGNAAIRTFLFASPEFAKADIENYRVSN